MPRFQLLVQELGREPRTVPLGNPIVVGRSRSVDLTVADEEVGRKQFRIAVTSGFVVLEGLGSTNPTRVDDATIEAGEKTTLPVGATIRVGKTVFTIASADETENVPSGPVDVPDVTMVAKGPAPGLKPPTPQPPAPPTPQPPAPQPQPSAEMPANTMEFKRPGMPGRPAPAPSAQEQTAPGGGPKPPGAPTPTPPAAPEGDRIDVTMQVRGPGIGGPPKPTPPSPPPKPQPAPAPKPQPAPAPQPKPAPPPPKPQPPRAAETQPKERPKTVAVRPEDMAPAPSTATPASGDVESRLHQTLPRLFVKSAGLKRRLRLMKVNNTVGRAENADVLLPHESVSEQHAEIRFDGERWLLKDLGSTNGCIIDGEHLRGGEQPMRRNALIGIGALHVIFLCNYKDTAAQDRRDEDRALQLMVRAGRVTRDEAAQIRRLVRNDQNQSVTEILLNETALGPVDWAGAIDKARSRKGLLAMILGLFSRR